MCLSASVRKVFATAILLFCSAGVASAQGVTGVQMFSTNENGVDLATGNINIDNITLRSKAGKIPFWSKLVGTSGMGLTPQYVWSSLFGLTEKDPIQTYFSVDTYRTEPCTYNGKSTYTLSFVHYPVITDSTGAAHQFNASWEIGDGPAGSNCANPTGIVGPVPSEDGSGYTLVVTNGNPTVYFANGSYVVGSCNSNLGCSMGPFVTDPDGATLATGPNGNGGANVTDSLGTTALTGTPDFGPFVGPTAISYPDANGNQQNYTISTTELHLGTNFGCINSAGSHFPEDTSYYAYIPTSITTPTGAQYTLSYEPTPGMSGYYTGRIAKITLPTGV